MPKRSNLISNNGPKKYIFGFILCLIFSTAGLFWLLNNKSEKEISKNKTEEQISVTPGIEEEVVASPTIKEILSFESETDNFSVLYKGTRKLFQDKEETGNRYTFYNYSGNITVHVGNRWSWLNSGRIFSETLLVGGEKTYIYEISNQKIVDFEKGDKKYTIQCIHNAQKEIKAECEKFFEDFKFI